MFEPGCQFLPLLGGDEPRDDVKGDDALLRGGFAINGKGDANAAEEEFSFLLAFEQKLRVYAAHPIVEAAIGITAFPVGEPHFVEKVTLFRCADGSLRTFSRRDER